MIQFTRNAGNTCIKWHGFTMAFGLALSGYLAVKKKHRQQKRERKHELENKSAKQENAHHSINKKIEIDDIVTNK